jgi:DNA-binding response OmpR family regulator
MTKPTILLIEDETAVSEPLRAALIKTGYSVITAENGAVGLSLDKFLKPDLIITDLMMPFMDGQHLMQKIAGDEYLAKVPFIVITGHPNLVKDLAGITINAVLLKPFHTQDLVKKVKELLPISS